MRRCSSLSSSVAFLVLISLPIAVFSLAALRTMATSQSNAASVAAASLHPGHG